MGTVTSGQRGELGGRARDCRGPILRAAHATGAEKAASIGRAGGIYWQLTLMRHECEGHATRGLFNKRPYDARAQQRLQDVQKDR
ncbi:hypothetical protein HDG38_006926 [Paraburkholderia sp. WSM4177]|nr:hypothetical protein [Paraburkholderia sp. WSM4177]MBB5488660.1 hypothetical protein [Paraburkholderia sp. WSM4180]